jgi:hypothetical protein
VTLDSIAKEQTKQKLLNLQSTQNTILNEIVLRDGTIKQKLNELADIIAERIDLLDPGMEGIGKEQISTEIARMLREKGCSIANWVNDYLPPKYKNKNLVRIHESVDKIVEIGTNVPCQLPEDCSSDQLEQWYQANDKEANTLDTIRTRNIKVKEKLEFIAQQRGLQLGGYKFRREISHKDFDEEVPEELKELVQNNCDLLMSISNGFKDIAEKYKVAPPRRIEELKEDYQVLYTFDSVFQPHHDFKSTGDSDHAFERQYISDMAGKHAAGNSDKFPTKLCAHCSKFETFDPDDFEIMHWDHTSPTDYRCRKCGGVDTIMRGMSREQVGDRQAFIVRQAQNVVSHMPLFGVTLHRWVKYYIQPKEDSRKTVISQFFQDGSISQATYKVARSPTK